MVRRFVARTLRPAVWLWTATVGLAAYLLKLYFDDVVLTNLKAFVTAHQIPERVARFLYIVLQHPVPSAVISTCAVVAWSALAASREIKYAPGYNRTGSPGHESQSLTGPTLSGFTKPTGPWWSQSPTTPLPIGQGPSLRFMPLEKRLFPEYGNATAILLPVRNDASTSKGGAENVVAHLTYQRLEEPLQPALEVHRGLWVPRDSDTYIGAGETLHLVLAFCDSRGCAAPNAPTISLPESSPDGAIVSCQLPDGRWRVVVVVRGEGFRTGCTVLMTVEGQSVRTFNVVSEKSA